MTKLSTYFVLICSRIVFYTLPIMNTCKTNSLAYLLYNHACNTKFRNTLERVVRSYRQYIVLTTKPITRRQTAAIRTIMAYQLSNTGGHISKCMCIYIYLDDIWRKKIHNILKRPRECLLFTKKETKLTVCCSLLIHDCTTFTSRENVLNENTV